MSQLLVFMKTKASEERFMATKRKELKGYCYECNQNVDFTVNKVKRTLDVRNVKITAEVYECYCNKCGNAVYVETYEKKNDLIVYDAYKKKMGLLTSDEIKLIRAKRGMTQVELAQFLNIGDKDIARYESGAIQTKSIDKMIRMVNDDLLFYRMSSLFDIDNDDDLLLLVGGIKITLQKPGIWDEINLNKTFDYGNNAIQKWGELLYDRETESVSLA